MATLSKPYTFTAGSYAVAQQVNADLDTLYNWVNGGSGIWADGSVPFTGIPSGPNADPTAANHLTRKSYVDGRVLVSLDGTNWPAGQQLRVVAQQNFALTYTAGANGTPISFPLFFDATPWVQAWPAPSPVGMTNIYVLNPNTSGFSIRAYNGTQELATNTVININYLALGN